MSPPYLPLIAFRPTRSIRTCVRMIVACALIPRFALLATLGDRKALLSRPIALAPCPELRLVPPDPERAEAAWEEALRRLEGMGAAVEPGCPGEAFFEADGLRGLCGGTLEGVLRRARE